LPSPCHPLRHKLTDPRSDAENPPCPMRFVDSQPLEPRHVNLGIVPVHGDAVGDVPRLRIVGVRTPVHGRLAPVEPGFEAPLRALALRVAENAPSVAIEAKLTPDTHRACFANERVSYVRFFAPEWEFRRGGAQTPFTARGESLRRVACRGADFRSLCPGRLPNTVPAVFRPNVRIAGVLACGRDMSGRMSWNPPPCPRHHQRVARKRVSHTPDNG